MEYDNRINNKHNISFFEYVLVFIRKFLHIKIGHLQVKGQGGSISSIELILFAKLTKMFDSKRILSFFIVIIF